MNVVGYNAEIYLQGISQEEKLIIRYKPSANDRATAESHRPEMELTNYFKHLVNGTDETLSHFIEEYVVRDAFERSWWRKCQAYNSWVQILKKGNKTEVLEEAQDILSELFSGDYRCRNDMEMLRCIVTEASAIYAFYKACLEISEKPNSSVTDKIKLMDCALQALNAGTILYEKENEPFGRHYSEVRNSHPSWKRNPSLLNAYNLPFLDFYTKFRMAESEKLQADYGIITDEHLGRKSGNSKDRVARILRSPYWENDNDDASIAISKALHRFSDLYQGTDTPWDLLYGRYKYASDLATAYLSILDRFMSEVIAQVTTEVSSSTKTLRWTTTDVRVAMLMCVVEGLTSSKQPRVCVVCGSLYFPKNPRKSYCDRCTSSQYKHLKDKQGKLKKRQENAEE